MSPYTRRARLLAGTAQQADSFDHRRFAIRILAAMVEHSDTITGATLITPDGFVEYIPAGHLRHGGRA